MKKYDKIFERLISPNNLFSAWHEFIKGKKNRKDIMRFDFDLEKNIFNLYRELQSGQYRHSPYSGFYITDPKLRHIHKAVVRDRVVHHAIYSVLNPIFEPTFIYDSYSCRKKKGSHRGVEQLKRMLGKASHNHTKKCFALKCDIKKFFQSVSHEILIKIIEKKISDQQTLNLLKIIIASFNPGLPIGNLTSQLFANIYLNEFDNFIKHRLKIRYYLRYTDDFIIVNNSKEELEILLKEIKKFLREKLMLEIHPHKVFIRQPHQGVDFLGYIEFPNHRTLRTKTKKRIFKKIKRGVSENSLQSYLGVLSHANSHKISEEIKNLYLFTKK